MPVTAGTIRLVFVAIVVAVAFGGLSPRVEKNKNCSHRQVNWREQKGQERKTDPPGRVRIGSEAGEPWLWCEGREPEFAK